ncbi:unnamed protein product [Oreochromis niloticus]|nr:unnamed protein product [Mustela putorius furo]
MEIGQTRAPPPSYLGWSYFSALCCCLPLGAFAIRYSKKVKAANEQGDIALAEDASQTAMALNIASVILGGIFITIFVIYKVNEIQELKKRH